MIRLRLKRWLWALLAVLVPACSESPAPNLVIVSLDTVRRDHLSVYGYPRPTTPTLEALARRAAVFENAFAQDVNTLPSHASMFTGLYPHQHGATFNGRPLGSKPPTLAEILRHAGFRTAAFVSGYTLRRKPSGLDRGFELYDDDLEGRRDGQATLQRALSWLADLPPGDEPFFLFFHLYDAHGPYHAPERYRALFRSRSQGRRLARVPAYQQYGFRPGEAPVHLQPYVDRYDAALRYMDDLVAELVRHLDLRRTVLVVLSDHGETLGERFHVLDHGAQVFDEQIRIPLLVLAPGWQPLRVTAFVETVDLAPTLLELLGVPPPKDWWVQGQSWLPLLRGDEAQPRLVFSSARAESSRVADRGYRLDPERRILAVRSAGWKLIRYPGVASDYFELYDLREDPQELRNRASQEPEVRKKLLEALEAWWGGAPEPGRPELTPHERERLRELGYIEHPESEP